MSESPERKIQALNELVEMWYSTGPKQVSTQDLLFAVALILNREETPTDPKDLP